ncbi:MAG: carboxypeptidase-like regulatory domain-containing protein [Leadbetterella sp.]|nr:carboxypeptidase-like regulatory domain-containing protein [Leadbetterella sp.]
MKKLLLLLFLPFGMLAQVSGTVVSETGNQPVPFASVFINNTTLGTTTDENGRFSISRVGPGKHELVVSVLGFEKFFTVISVPLGKPLILPLREKSTQLDAVTVRAFDKNGWKTWGKLFTESFIGTTSNARRTVLKNPGDLRFRHDKQNNILEVFAVAPLKIRNKSLGYELEYHLELFRIDFRLNSQVYAGYPYFREHGSVSRARTRNREDTYNASLLKFMRSLYHNTVQQDGYNIMKMIETRNTEKDRVRALRDKYTLKERDDSGRLRAYGLPAYPGDIYTPDSLEYFRKILSQPDSRFALLKDSIPTAQLVKTDTSGVRKFSFKDYLYVVNTRFKEELLYLEYKREKRAPAPQTSTLKMVEEEEPIEIQESGNYFPPLNLYTGDYWTWSNKISDLLPLDYKPRSSVP